MPQATAPALSAVSAAKPVKADVNGTQQATSASPAAEHSIDAIGWLFLQKYYGSYTTDKTSLYAFYDTAASAVSHEDFPNETPEIDAEGKAVKTVRVANGKDAIRALFEAGAEQKSKIVVESATFQKSVGESILIVVSGSWKQGSSPLWQFTQTFVLKPTGKTVYDIANDVLKFVDLSAEFSQTQTQVTEEKQAATPENELTEEPKEEINERVPETVSEVEEAEPKASVLANEPVAAVEPVAPNGQGTATEETSEASSTEISEPVGETSAELASEKNVVEEPAVPATPAQKPTWANLAAIGLKTTGKAAVVVSPVAAKTTAPAASPAATPGLATKKASSPSQAASVNGKYKKEEWYPIYIKNVDVEEEELKAAIIKQFGDIKYFKKTNKTALCDFKSKDDQQRALEIREMVIKNNVILLEPRVHKSYNNGNNGGNVNTGSNSNKPDAKKDKKNLKKSGFKKN